MNYYNLFPNWNFLMTGLPAEIEVINMWMIFKFEYFFWLVCLLKDMEAINTCISL